MYTHVYYMCMLLVRYMQYNIQIHVVGTLNSDIF